MPIVGSPIIDATDAEYVVLRDEIRNFMRDYPQLNILLDAVEFENKDIDNAIKRVTQWYNVMPVMTNLTWRNVPEILIFQGAAAQLLLSGAILKFRNQASVPTDGLGVIGLDDNAAAYVNLAQQMMAEVKQAMRDTKTEMNQRSFYGSLSSGYANVSRFTYR